MNKIIIDPHYCTEEEYQELKDYLTNKTWDWQEVSSGEEVPEGHKTTEILQHDIEWWADGFKEEILPDTEKEHIEYQIGQGMREGELNIGEEEHRGWWKIKK
mgnify:CR=1 FL=1